MATLMHADSVELGRMKAATETRKKRHDRVTASIFCPKFANSALERTATSFVPSFIARETIRKVGGTARDAAQKVGDTLSGLSQGIREFSRKEPLLEAALAAQR